MAEEEEEYLSYVQGPEVVLPPDFGIKAGVTLSAAAQAQYNNDNKVFFTPVNYATIDNPTFTGTGHCSTKAIFGLGNVDSAADTNKPISRATQDALDFKRLLSTTPLSQAPPIPALSQRLLSVMSIT